MSFARDTRGTTAIEYSIIAAGIAMVIIAAVNAIGVSVSGMFQAVLTGL